MANISNLSGARRINLIGRGSVLKQILKVYKKVRKPTIWYFEGKGGIGKTAVIKEIRKQVIDDKWGEVLQIIDLYHVEYQTPVGLVGRLLEVLPPSPSFAGVKKKLADMENHYRHHDAEAAEKAWQDAQQSLIQGINTLSRTTPLLLLFDTAEVLAVLAASQGDEESDVGHWLFHTIFPRLSGRVFVIMAGRPKQHVKDYVESLPDRWDVKIPEEYLPPLNEPESQLYLEGVAQMLEDNGNQRGAKRIHGHLKHYGAKYLHRGTGGKPLRLALVTDILLAGGKLPLYFYQETDQQPQDDILDKALVEHLRKLRSPLGDVLRTLGYLPKGGDEKLVADLLGADPDDDMITEAFQAAHHLALVKHREGVALPYFLHDEVYTLFAKFFPLSDEKRRHALKTIRQRYETETTILKRKIRRFQAMQADLAYRKRVVDVELVHYAAWVEPMMGFAEYHVRAMEAAEMRDPVPTLLLKHEIYRVLQNLEKNGRSVPQDVWDNVEWSERLRSVERDVLLHNKYEVARNKITAWQDEKKSVFSQADLTYVQAVLDIKQSRLDAAKGKLESAHELTSDTDTSALKGKLHLPLAKDGLHAWIDNYLGYIARLQGQYGSAIAPYQHAAIRMRKQKLKGLSGVLVNHAYALIMMGWHKNARKVIREAMDEARQQLHTRDEIRAFNVWAIIETRAGNPEKGHAYGEQALQLLQSHPSPGLEAYIRINLARALRYAWNNDVVEKTGERWRTSWRKWLLPAVAHLEGLDTVRKFFGDEAWDKIKRELLPEEKGAIQLSKGNNATQVEAYVEAGCIWRELSWVKRKLGGNNVAFKVKDFSHKIEERLQLAAVGKRLSDGMNRDTWLPLVCQQIARIGGSPYWPALALANMGWHYHYQRQDSQGIKVICEMIENVIGDEYLWTPDSPPRIAIESGIEHAEVLRWTVLGKMEMLRAHEYLHMQTSVNDKEDAKEYIRKAAKHALISLEYNYLIGSNVYDLERAENGLEHRLLSQPNWITELLPIFYQEALEEQKKIVRKGLEGSQGNRDTKLVRILRERFGPPDMWF